MLWLFWRDNQALWGKIGFFWEIVGLCWENAGLFGQTIDNGHHAELREALKGVRKIAVSFSVGEILLCDENLRIYTCRYVLMNKIECFWKKYIHAYLYMYMDMYVYMVCVYMIHTYTHRHLPAWWEPVYVYVYIRIYAFMMMWWSIILTCNCMICTCFFTRIDTHIFLHTHRYTHIRCIDAHTYLYIHRYKYMRNTPAWWQPVHVHMYINIYFWWVSE